MTLPQPASPGAAMRSTPPVRRRQPPLHELIRDLAGWTLPAPPATTSRLPDNWGRAWATRR